jgi:hypothetical protein
MDTVVQPLALTQIDWDTYINFFQEVIGRSPTHDLDAHLMQVGELDSFIASLAVGIDPRQALRNNNTVLKHVSAGFMTNATSETIRVIMETGIAGITYTDYARGNPRFFSILSGTVEDWKNTILSLCTPATSFEVRFVVNSCCLYLEKASLFEVFGNYGKDTLSDKTFILRRKS